MARTTIVLYNPTHKIMGTILIVFAALAVFMHRHEILAAGLGNVDIYWGMLVMWSVLIGGALLVYPSIMSKPMSIRRSP